MTRRTFSMSRGLLLIRYSACVLVWVLLSNIQSILLRYLVIPPIATLKHFLWGAGGFPPLLPDEFQSSQW